MSRALVTGGTKSDTAPMAVFAINIRDICPNSFDTLVVFHDGIRKKDQELINNIFPTRFIQYKYRYVTGNDEVISHFSPMVFCKYECFSLLRDYDEVVWSDYDVVIRGDISEIWQFKDDIYFNILERDSILRTMFYKDIISSEIKEYDLDDLGINTPLFALSNKLHNYSEIAEWCYLKTNSWDKDLFLPEQCIVSLATQEFGVSFNEIPARRYVTFPENAIGDELILHAAGQPKFWNGRQNEEWDKRYEEWILLGGTKYYDWIKKLNNKIKFLLARLKGVRGRTHE